MAFPQGIDFRSTKAFVTDPANCDFSSGSTAYPTTSAQGNTVGWEVATTTDADVTALTGAQAKLAGIAYQFSSTTTYKYRVDLPATGSYNVRVACGRADSTAQGVGLLDLYDTTTLLAHLVTDRSSITGNTFYDATDVQRTSAADWVANNAVNTQTFSSTILRFQFGPSAGGHVSLWAHLWVEANAGGGTAVTATVGIETWAGQTAALNIQTNVAATAGLETWAGQTAALNIMTNVAATSGLETWSGNVASVKFNTAISVGSGLETWSGLAATVTTGGAAGVKKAKVFRVGKRVIYGG